MKQIVYNQKIYHLFLILGIYFFSSLMYTKPTSITIQNQTLLDIIVIATSKAEINWIEYEDYEYQPTTYFYKITAKLQCPLDQIELKQKINMYDIPYYLKNIIGAFDHVGKSRTILFQLSPCLQKNGVSGLYIGVEDPASKKSTWYVIPKILNNNTIVITPRSLGTQFPLLENNNKVELFLYKILRGDFADLNWLTDIPDELQLSESTARKLFATKGHSLTFKVTKAMR